jgi:hypothetical protein
MGVSLSGDPARIYKAHASTSADPPRLSQQRHDDRLDRRVPGAAAGAWRRRRAGRLATGRRRWRFGLAHMVSNVPVGLFITHHHIRAFVLSPGLVLGGALLLAGGVPSRRSCSAAR